MVPPLMFSVVWFVASPKPPPPNSLQPPGLLQKSQSLRNSVPGLLICVHLEAIGGGKHRRPDIHLGDPAFCWVAKADGPRTLIRSTSRAYFVLNVCPGEKKGGGGRSLVVLSSKVGGCDRSPVFHCCAGRPALANKNHHPPF